MRELLTGLIFVFFSVPMAFADPHWWVLARGTDFKTYDKCVVGDAVASPTEVYQSGERLGWSPQLADRGSEVDVEIIPMSAPLSFRWFRTEAACQAAARANDLGAGGPGGH